MTLSRRRSAPRPARAAAPVLLFSLAATILPAQDPAPPRSLPDIVADLAKADRQEKAIAELAQFGKTVVPGLIARVQRPEVRSDRTFATGVVRALGAFARDVEDARNALADLAKDPDLELARVARAVLLPLGCRDGLTVIADYSDNAVVIVDAANRVIAGLNDIYGAWDAELLPSGNLLLTEFAVSRVRECTLGGKTVWTYENLRNPYDADRLANGNTLIADTFRGRVIEVDAAGKVVWSYAGGIRPFDADRLANGNTLIADVLGDSVIEVDAAGKIVWEKKDLPTVHDADRLPDGHTLITLRTLNRVIELDASAKEVWRLADLHAPSDADRLPNGNTLVAENNMVREFDRAGVVVWKREMTWAVEANRY